MDRACPGCRRRILNRRLFACEFCGAPLPLEALLSPEEQAAEEERAVDREELERAWRHDARRALRARRRRRRRSWLAFLGSWT